jgi:acetyl-CoA carboxylase biotin carboxyl carrier protein
MDLNQIKRLIKLVESSNIEELEIQEEGFQVRITKGKSESNIQYTANIPQMVQPASNPPHHVHQEAHIHEAHLKNVEGEKSENLMEICSPMVGTFYKSPAPDSGPYVKEGDIIQPGQVLCIVEAMKLMNEIEAEISGKIVKILVEDAQPVEYNQPLFLVEKT